jgi:dienelactone hydrolase
MAVTTTTFEYADADAICAGHLALPAADGVRRPCVLIAHQWAGVSDHERERARTLAGLGYVGFALDVYGAGVRGDPMGDNSALMNPWVADRVALRNRLMAAVAAARAHPAVDPARIAMIGYCFGGLCVLDVARSGTADVRGVVSLHGVLAPTGLTGTLAIRASVLVLHGWADPMAPPDAVLALASELTAAGADWQLHAYGHAMHAFTAAGVDKAASGLKYDANAARRAWQATTAFLADVLA